MLHAAQLKAVEHLSFCTAWHTSTGCSFPECASTARLIFHDVPPQSTEQLAAIAASAQSVHSASAVVPGARHCPRSAAGGRAVVHSVQMSGYEALYAHPEAWRPGQARAHRRAAAAMGEEARGGQRGGGDGGARQLLQQELKQRGLPESGATCAQGPGAARAPRAPLLQAQARRVPRAVVLGPEKRLCRRGRCVARAGGPAP